MASRTPEPGSPLEDAGIPDLEDVTPGDRMTGWQPDTMEVTHDRPLASESWGTTAAEQRAGEPLDVRLAHEEPDLVEAYPVDPGGDVGRLVEPDEGARTDTEKDTVARDVGSDGGGLSAEEAAIHLTDQP